MAVLGKNQVDAGPLEISVEQQLRIGDDNRIRRSVRSGRRNGFEVAVRMRMRA